MNRRSANALPDIIETFRELRSRVLLRAHVADIDAGGNGVA